jgi:hypothetical protein
MAVITRTALRQTRWTRRMMRTRREENKLDKCWCGGCVRGGVCACRTRCAARVALAIWIDSRVVAS